MQMITMVIQNIVLTINGGLPAKTAFIVIQSKIVCWDAATGEVRTVSDKPVGEIK